MSPSAGLPSWCSLPGMRRGRRSIPTMAARAGFTFADATAIGLADARKLANEIMYQVAQGKDPAAERRASRDTDTFEQLAIRYCKHTEGKNKSWRQADKLVTRFLIPAWGQLAAAEIARSDVNALVAKIKAPIVANQTLAAASAIFSWALKKEFASVKINPCVGVDRNQTTERERVLSDSEVPLFWSAFDDAGLIRSSILKMILLTGQRPGEVLHMRTEHIEDGWWTLPGKPVVALGWPGTKNAATHRVWLSKPAQRILAEMDSTGFVFASSRGARSIASSGLSRAMADICKALDVERATPHDLRRTNGTTITSLGFGREAMNRIQNHREGGIADVYDRHKYEIENKTIMEAVANKIMALIEGGSDNVIRV